MTDIRQFSITASQLQAILDAAAQQQQLTASADALISLDANDKLMLKGVAAASLHTSDFLLHT